MVSMTQAHIAALQNYAVAVRQMATEFYDERFQPRPAVKQDVIEQFGGFTDPATALAKAAIYYDTDCLLKALEEKSCDRIMTFKRGNTAQTFILEDDTGDWTLLRSWSREDFEVEKRDRDSVILQPIDTIALDKPSIHGGPWQVEIMPFMCMTNITQTGGMSDNTDISKIIGESAYIVEIFMRDYFKRSGLDCLNLADMAILPNGIAVFADPDKCHRTRAVRSDRERMEQFADYQKATQEHPEIHTLMGYFQPDGTDIQQAFFPSVKSCCPR